MGMDCPYCDITGSEKVVEALHEIGDFIRGYSEKKCTSIRGSVQ
jgi:hypothetical protein